MNFEYKVLTAPTAEKLTQDVGRGLDEDWEVTGGVSVASTPGGLIFAQAMVRHCDPDEDF